MIMQLTLFVQIVNLHLHLQIIHAVILSFLELLLHLKNKRSEGAIVTFYCLIPF
jgi:hypothetical protein